MRGGTARDVLGAHGCLGIEARSTLVGEMGAARDYGQERGKVVFEALYTLDGRKVDLTSAAGDALGMGGGRARPTCTPAPRRCASPSPPPSISAALNLGGRGDGLNILLGVRR